MALKQISRARFNALCYSRQPRAAFLSKELEWWADADERVLGIVILDTQDHDWAWIILGRDEKALFRAIDLSVSIASQDDAKRQLHEKLEEYSRSGAEVFPQFDTDNKKNELLIPAVPDSKLHPNFKILVAGDHHSAARALIREIAYAFVDVDGNYRKDFQTTGFNGRLWELYLFAFLYEQQFAIPREFDRPDFCAIKFGVPVGIEAATVNPSDGETPPSPQTPEEMRKRPPGRL